jgi:FAD synthetase
MAYGAFDLLHPGHLHYLKEARKLGDSLVVVLTTDENVKKSKGKPPVNDQEHRKEIVASLRMIDEAVIGEEKDYYKIVQKIKPAIIALGYDQAEKNELVEKELKKRGFDVEVVRITPFKEGQHKSSKIKERIRNADS